MFSVLLLRVARVAPFAALALLLGAWALCVWGRDQSLFGILATHLPATLYGLLALAALLACALAPSWPGALAAIACLPLAFVPLGGWTLASQKPATATGYRALTWNVEQWSYGGAQLARLVADVAPDVFCLQEARSYGTYPNDVEWQAFEAGLPDYRLLRFGDMAIGTRWPVLDERRTRLHPELWRRPLLEVTLQAPDGGRLRVLNAHLVYTGYYGKRPSALVTSARERRAQAERIIEHVAASSDPTLVCGDLNASPNSEVLSVLQQRLSDAWRLRGQGFGTTSRGWLSRRIDYLLVSGVEVGDIRVLDASLSDHRPVTATFSLAPALARREAPTSTHPR
ncbi:MAG TPA: endonuclease/exonuclease/phosphatase family protein [Polyangiaceae bacterium]|nr:endonuclease/exonuclease/phosphatase family protein [Polyangiaceae bacterium]